MAFLLYIPVYIKKYHVKVKYSKLCLNDSGRYHEVGCVYWIRLYKVLRIILRNEIDQNRFFSIDSGMRRPQTSAVIMLSNM